MTELTFADAFCGAGGMSLGLEKAGFQSILAFDLDEMAVETYRRNLGVPAVVADARAVAGEEIIRDCGLKRGELDLLAGGPPCQGFSKQKKGAHNGDKRNSLILEFVRLIQELQPRSFFFENVAIFGQKRGRKFLNCMEWDLTEYNLHSSFLNAADFGLAQTRERFVIVGVRKDLGFEFTFPSSQRKQKECWKTVGEVLNGLPEPPEDFTDHPDYPNHQRARVTPVNVERFSHVPQGGGWQDIPYHLRIEAHKKANTKAGGWPDVYGRLEWDGQCPTITGGFDSFTRGRYGHPFYDRPLTPREAARLQGFPDEFVFLGTRADIRRQIGNAVPPPLARKVGVQLNRCLRSQDRGLVHRGGIWRRDAIQPLLPFG